MLSANVVKLSRQLHWRNLHEPPPEGDNAANYEKIQAIILKNLENIRQLRQENKRLNERLAEANAVSPHVSHQASHSTLSMWKKKKSWFLLVSCSPGRWAPHQRGLWEQRGRDRGLPQHVGQGERTQFLSFHNLLIFLSRGRLFLYFNNKSHPDWLLVFLSLTNLLARLPWRRWTRRCCPREKSSTP